MTALLERYVRIDIIDLCQSGGMADAADSKSVARKGVWVQVPPLVFNFFYSLCISPFAPIHHTYDNINFLMICASLPNIIRRA